MSKHRTYINGKLQEANKSNPWLELPEQVPDVGDMRNYTLWAIWDEGEQEDNE